jgi:DHA3 family multidrug efflux protein-like MFS transporter
MPHFYQALINTLIANVTTSYLWFALTFWAYLETKSVLATGIIGGSYMLLMAVFGLVFGTYVDHHKKKQAMVLSSMVTLVMFSLAAIMYVLVGQDALADLHSPLFWLFIVIVLAGGVIENMRNIALSTTVTLLVPKDDHDKANGMVGATQGVGFIVTSALSGLSIGLLGLGWTLAVALVFTIVAFLHLLFFVQIPEPKLVHDATLDTKKIDIRGAMKAIHAVPGLLALIFFSTVNNLIGGVYMALMDPYGLTLFRVEQWGAVFAVAGTGFVVGGLLIAKFGLGKNPLRTLLRVLLVMGALGAIFTIREWWWLYAVGIWLYMCLVPFAEAAEQTVVQRVVPLKQQGRVFGFAQSVEAAAAPVTAFMIAPLAQFFIIPYADSPAGSERLSGLLGNGEVRGIALVFLVAGLAMIAVTLLAFRTKAYILLSQKYRQS